MQEIRATTLAFCALLADGSAVTWGEPQVGGDSSASVESDKWKMRRNKIENDDWKMWFACKFQGHPVNSMEMGNFACRKLQQCFFFGVALVLLCFFVVGKR